MPKNSHLSLQDRSIIEHGITNHLSFKDIAHQLDKDPSTISKEVRKHIEVVDTGAYGRPFNPCIHTGSCDKTFVCSLCYHGGKRCSFCNAGCYKHCDDYEEYVWGRNAHLTCLNNMNLLGILILTGASVRAGLSEKTVVIG